MLSMCFCFLKILFLTFVFTVSVLSITAQERELPLPIVNPLIDQFEKINSEHLQQRLDFVTQRIREAPNSTLVVIIYRENTQTVGFQVRYGTKIKTYLSRNKAIEPERIKIINGGRGPMQTSQIYLLPRNPDIYGIPEDSKWIETVKKTILFDSYDYYNHETASKYGVEGCCSVDYMHAIEAKASLDVFAEILKANPTAKGYLIGYSQYCVGCIQIGPRKIVERDSPQIGQNILRQEKDYLVKKHGIDSTRISTKFGGYKEFRNVELYIVPENGKIPKAKPETFPPNLSTRIKKKARSN